MRPTTPQVHISSNTQLLPTEPFEQNRGQLQRPVLSASSSVTACSVITEPGRYPPGPASTYRSPPPVPQAPEFVNAQNSLSVADAQRPSISFMANRPSAVPFTDVESLSQILPPKRKLPFSRAALTRHHCSSQQDPANHDSRPAHPRSLLSHTSSMPQISAITAGTMKGSDPSFSVPTRSTGEHAAVQPGRGTSPMVSHLKGRPVETGATKDSRGSPRKRPFVHSSGSYPLEGDTVAPSPYFPLIRYHLSLIMTTLLSNRSTDKLRSRE